MEDPVLYSAYNTMQRRDSLDIITEFFPQMSWMNETECVLDVGCGPGDVTAGILLPRLPSSATVVGVDVCIQMVEYANKRYGKERLTFKVQNIASRESLGMLRKESFSKIVSFYCLHFNPNHHLVAKNFFSLLQRGGEFLVVFMSPTNTVFTVLMLLKQMEKWKAYTKDGVEFYQSKDSCKDIRNIWITAGLELMYVQEREGIAAYANMKTFMASFEAVNPYVRKMDPVTKEEFMEDYKLIVEHTKLITKTHSGEIRWKYKYLVIFGKKECLV